MTTIDHFLVDVHHKSAFMLAHIELAALIEEHGHLHHFDHQVSIVELSAKDRFAPLFKLEWPPIFRSSLQIQVLVSRLLVGSGSQIQPFSS